jgi:hypothetical protein
MTYLVLSKIEVQQIPTDAFPNRNKLLAYTYMNKYEVNSTWADLTQTLTLTLPKRITLNNYTNENNVPFTYGSKNDPIRTGNTTGQGTNLSGFDDTPLFLRGDLIRFNVGYRGWTGVDSGNRREETYMTGTNGLPHLFEGVIAKVQTKTPFTLECEDYMWLLKQMPTPAKQWGDKTLQDIVTEAVTSAQDQPIIKRYNNYVKLKVSDFSTTDLHFNVNNFITQRGSLASLLARIKSEYRIDSYFRGMSLRIGLLHYLADDVTQPYPVFTFQKNILDNDKLKWSRKDDTVLSMIVRSNYLIEKDGETTKDGKTKTTHKSTEILITNQAGTFTAVTKEKGKDFPTKYLNDIGERFTMNIYDNITDTDKLFAIGKAQLEKYYYDGFKGSFTTFGIPHIKHGDTVQIVNKQLPEQTGYYKVKAVRYYGGYEEGLRQEITLDYKVSE